MHDVRRAPLARRPGLLFALLVAQLRRRSAAAIGDSLTHRELLGVAGTLGAAEGETFRTVVEAAERATFGGWRPAEAEMESLLARGEMLLERWAAAEDRAQ
jgi:hypothetical protein